MDKSKQYFWDVLAVLALAMVVFVVFAMWAVMGWKDSLAPARTITVTAQGMTTATPDEGQISFSVVTQGANPQTLSDNNNTKMSSVIQFLSSQGIASSDITTTGYDLEPNYSYGTVYAPSNGPIIPAQPSNTITGYTLTQTVQVNIKDLTKVASVLGGLAPLGVNQIGSVSYTFQNPNEFIGIARMQALANAKTEASQMASQAGAGLGEVVTVTESSNVPYPQPGVFAMNATAGGATAAIAPTVEPGTQNVTDEVTVTYQLN